MKSGSELVGTQVRTWSSIDHLENSEYEYLNTYAALFVRVAPQKLTPSKTEHLALPSAPATGMEVELKPCEGNLKMLDQGGKLNGSQILAIILAGATLVGLAALVRNGCEISRSNTSILPSQATESSRR